MACKDCVAEGLSNKRPTPHPGPRCTSHHRVFRAQARQRLHDAHVVRTYGLGPGDYERLLEAQGGVCAGCGPRTGYNGKTKRLAVDHNHETGEVRGLLCSRCNRSVGEQRDDPDTFLRLGEYLRNPPARQTLTRTEDTRDTRGSNRSGR